MFYQKRNICALICCCLFLFGSIQMNAQLYNKEVGAKIIIEKNSEFFTFKARAVNLTNSDFSLRYEFMVFKKDDKGNVSKSSQENRFFLKANDMMLLSSTTINYNVESEIILVLLIYDENNKPIGQDRIELPKGGKSEIAPTEYNNTDEGSNEDQSNPQDGFVLGGFIFNKTITKAGRDFHRYFFNTFTNADIKTKKNISIKEVPARGRSTRVSVLVENRLVWQFFSQARKEFLKEMAQESLRRVTRELIRLERQKEELTYY
jgi:Curli assembly protein CsgE